MKTQRLFIACPLPEVIRQEITGVRSTMRLLFPHGVAWTEPVDIHLTLVFLGRLTVEEAVRADQVIAATLHRSTPQEFLFALNILDAFPSPDTPRVVVVRVKDLDGTATALQQELRKALHAAALPVESRAWEPHITIGKNKEITKLKHVPSIDVHPFEWVTNSIHLMVSSVKHTGPKYSIKKEYSLLN